MHNPLFILPNLSQASNYIEWRRGQEYKIAKSRDVFRTVVLGDSITMYGEYTDLLEDMLIVGFCLNDFFLTPVMFKDTSGKMHCYRPFKLFKGIFDPDDRANYIHYPGADYIHPNKKAHEIVAEVILKYLIANRIIQISG